MSAKKKTAVRKAAARKTATKPAPAADQQQEQPQDGAQVDGNAVRVPERGPRHG